MSIFEMDQDQQITRLGCCRQLRRIGRTLHRDEVDLWRPPVGTIPRAP